MKNEKPFEEALVKKSKLDDKTAPPQILLGYMRGQDGNITGVRHVDFKAGIRIQRCGKVYEVKANGQQVRVN
jgi:hypothetical protein